MIFFHVKGGLIAGHAAIQRSDLFTCLILSAAAVEIPVPRFFIWFVVSLIVLYMYMYMYVNMSYQWCTLSHPKLRQHATSKLYVMYVDVYKTGWSARQVVRIPC